MLRTTSRILIACTFAFASACGDDDAAPTAEFSVRESVEQFHITHATPGDTLEVVDADGNVVASGEVDEQGSLIFRELEPGNGYRVRVMGSDEAARGLTVMSVENSLPEETFYSDQVLQPGFGYLTTRDGTKLSIFVSLPGPIEDGPYPTVVNYSGYDPSKPGAPIAAGAAFCGTLPILCDAPNDQSGLIAGLMGYASVGVNIRGTGCSGGAFDYWETLQVLDGYDAIEVVAHQPWVMHGKVGMTGLSYPGISQLFVAQTQPPHLAAITPLSVLADSAVSTLRPGGIFNEGFALNWTQNVLDGAQPFGKGWEMDVVADELAALEPGTDAVSTCEENQLLHSQYVNAVDKAFANAFYTEEVAGPLAPVTFVDKINVPVFLTGQWQDEQTGPHFATLLDKFDNAPIKRFTVTNGVHPDGFSPQALIEWKTFLDLYVAQQVPVLDPLLEILGPQLFAGVFKEALAFPAVRFDSTQSYEDVLAAYEAEPEVRVIFESGADPTLDNPGAPSGTFDEHFEAWPIPGTEAHRLYFAPDGTLQDAMPATDGGSSSFDHEAAAGMRTTMMPMTTSDNDVWSPQPAYDYRPLVPGKAVAFVSEPLAEDLVMIGTGSVDLWMQSSAPDADIEVNLTEVRADGKESYVQSGWLRTSLRKLAPDATELLPTYTMLEDDAAPLPSGTWEPVRVMIMPFAHIFRAGSSIRISVDTPGDSRAVWTFILQEYSTPPTHSIAHHAAHPSSVVLPVIPGVAVPTAMPDCTALRGQPCRDVVPFVNTLD